MSARRANPTYLPDITFPAGVRPTASLADALGDARHVIVAVPSHGLRAVVRAAAPHIPAGCRARVGHEGPRDRHAGADVGSAASRRRATVTRSWRCRVRASPQKSRAAADGARRRVDRRGRRPCRAGRVPRAAASACTDRTTSSASKSARRSRTSSRSPPASSSRWSWGTTRWRRSSRAAWRRSRASRARWAGGAKRSPG